MEYFVSDTQLQNIKDIKIMSLEQRVSSLEATISLVQDQLREISKLLEDVTDDLTTLEMTNEW